MSVSRHISGQRVFVSHFPHFSVFFSYSISYSIHYSFSPISVLLNILQLTHCVFLIIHHYQISRSVPGLKVCISNFPRFWVFPAIFQVKVCFCDIFHVFLFSFHIPCPTVWISHFLPFQRSWPYFTTYSACFSISMIFSLLAIF